MFMQVDDPSKYGVIILDEYGRVQQFVEKPKVSRAYCFC
jgi:mannose-1-phosphate guanylyltransferase